MAVNKVTNPSQRILGTSINLKRPLNGIAYPVLGLMVVASFAAFGIFLALNVGVPLLGRGAQRIPFVGDQLAQGANQNAPAFGA